MLETESISHSASINLLPVTTEVYIGLFLLFLLLFFSALVSGAEVSFFSLSTSDKSAVNNSRKKTHQFIRDMLNVPDKLLATIQIANILTNISIVIFSTYLITKTIDFSSSPIIGFFFQLAVIIFVVLVFCEILPKIYASNNKLIFTKLAAWPLRIAMFVLAPFSYMLIHSTSFINERMLKYKKNISINDISHALELTSGEEKGEDKGILEGIVKFGSTSVYQIMTPRIDVVAIDFEMTPDKIIEIINNSGYSRMPVYNETFDKIEGILYIKDLLPHLNNMADFNWQTILRQPYYVPENKKIDDLLKEFQKTKVHIAVVVDEYGGTSGIVTLEDILEEIVGDIADEFDDDDRLYTRINDTTFIFDGKTQLNDFFRICDLNDKLFDDIKGEADSLAGLLLEIKSDFPKLNEKLSYQHIDFIVESIDNRRIKKIKIIFNKKYR